MLNIACDLLLVSFMFVAATVLQNMEGTYHQSAYTFDQDKSKQFRTYQPKAALTRKNV